jgi:hypothetical protein
MLALARTLHALGMTPRAAAELAFCDPSDPDSLAEALGWVDPFDPGPLHPYTMRKIADALGIGYVERDGDSYLVPTGAKWTARDDHDRFTLDLPLGATDDDLLAELEACNGYDPTDHTYVATWDAEIELVDACAVARKIKLTADLTVHPHEPDCIDDDDHDWQTPHAVLGGLKENPGVRGNGGGVIVRRVCARCGCYRTTNTWATNPSDGTPMTSVSYEEADENSQAWVASLSED